jgi:hypothetical protein
MKLDKYDVELAIYSLMQTEWNQVDRKRIVNLLTSGSKLTDAEAQSVIAAVAAVQKKKLT